MCGRRQASPQHGRLHQDVFHDFAEDIGEAVAAALEFVGEAFVIDAEEVEDGRVQVVDVHGVFRDVVAVIVGFTVGDTRLYAATGHPE